MIQNSMTNHDGLVKIPEDTYYTRQGVTVTASGANCAS